MKEPMKNNLTLDELIHAIDNKQIECDAVILEHLRSCAVALEEMAHITDEYNDYVAIEMIDNVLEGLKR